MKKSKNFIRLRILIPIILLLIMIPSTVSKASSASITFSAEENTVVKGEDFIVSIKLTSKELLGDFEAYITYNDDVLEFKSGASFIAGGDGLLKLTDKDVTGSETTRKYVIKFKAKDIGTSEIAIKDTAEIYEYESGLSMSYSTDPLTIKVVTKETASKNANLKSLKINPGTLVPEFNKTTTEYLVNLESDVERLIISSVPEDYKASVSLKGNENLKAGDNKVTIIVEAESGDKKTYTIHAKKPEEEKNSQDEITEKDTADTINDTDTEEYNNTEEENKTTGLQIKKDGDSIILKNSFSYTITEPDENTQIPEGYIKTTLKINGITINAYTLKTDLDSDFLLFYAKNEDGKADFYQYDRKEETLQRFYPVKVKDNSGKVVMSDDRMQSEEYKNRLFTMGIIIAVLGAVCMILSIAVIKLYMKDKDQE